MKKIAILATLIIFSCSKEEEENKPQPVVYPITFTDEATPNNWEYNTTTNMITVNASFNPAPLIDSNKRDDYYVQVSTVTDFKTVKSNQLFTTLLKPLPIKVQKGLDRRTFEFNKVAYFRVRRIKDSITSETRTVNINWK